MALAGGERRCASGAGGGGGGQVDRSEALVFKKSDKNIWKTQGLVCKSKPLVEWSR